MFHNHLPDHPPRTYPEVGACIYCGKTENLSDEHIIPYGMGGRWVLPKASCQECAAITGAFEGTCLRTMFGPTRMYYDLPSRRKKDRPEKLPLQVKYIPDQDWTTIDVDAEVFPFLITMPFYSMPDELSGYTTAGIRNEATKNWWIRGASFRYGMKDHLEKVCKELGVSGVYPTATGTGLEFCLLLAKIAHAYAIAELEPNSFTPILPEMIRTKDTSNRVQFIGGLCYEEDGATELHEVSFDSHTCDKPDIVSVRIKLLAVLGTPTYYVAAGRWLS